MGSRPRLGLAEVGDPHRIDPRGGDAGVGVVLEAGADIGFPPDPSRVLNDVRGGELAGSSDGRGAASSS